MATTRNKMLPTQPINGPVRMTRKSIPKPQPHWSRCVDGVSISLWMRTDIPKSFLLLEFQTIDGGRGGLYIPRRYRCRTAEISRNITNVGGTLPWPEPNEKLDDLLMTMGLQPHLLVPSTVLYNGVPVPKLGWVRTHDNRGRTCAVRVQFAADLLMIPQHPCATDTNNPTINVEVQQPWHALKSALCDKEQVVRLDEGNHCPRPISHLLGIRRKRKGSEVVAFFGGALRKLLGGEFKAVVDTLHMKGALLVEGRTDSLTSQVPIYVKGNLKPIRRRLYIMQARVLTATVADHCRLNFSAKPAINRNTESTYRRRINVARSDNK